MRGSYCGVTVGNGWMYNNPDLIYPEGHEFMNPNELRSALTKESAEPEFIEFLIDDEPT